MSVSRIKTIFIAALLLVNGFFLAIIVIDTYADARDERQAIENACAILQLNGISINPDSIKTANSLRTMRTERGVEPEAAIAYAFLGTADMTDQGVIYLYENADRGTAEFFTAGIFEVHLNEGVITNENGTLRTVRELLQSMKLETSEIAARSESGGETVTVVSAYRGVSIFNCTIDFVFSGSSLISVSGRYVTGIEPAEDGAVISSVSTALLGFLASVKNGDVECMEILSVEAGYHHNVVGSFGEAEIAPAWLITTANAKYIIDSVTGEIRQM